MTFALGLVLLVLTWRRASFVLAIAAALVLSPIVWFDFMCSPRSRSRSRVRACRSSGSSPSYVGASESLGIAADPVWGVGRVLLVYGIVLLVAAQSEPGSARLRLPGNVLPARRPGGEPERAVHP